MYMYLSIPYLIPTQGQQQMYIQPVSGTPTLQLVSPMTTVAPVPSSAPLPHQPSTPLVPPDFAAQQQPPKQHVGGTVAIMAAPPPPPYPDQHPVVEESSIWVLQAPMSSLGKRLCGEKPGPSFPDPSSLTLAPPPPSDGGELFCRPLAESWWTVPLETCLRGVRVNYPPLPNFQLSLSPSLSSPLD